jgi:dienelactone hydrolase
MLRRTSFAFTAAATVLALLEMVFLVWQGDVKAGEKETSVKFTEEIVYAQSEDGVPSAGVLFAASKDSARSTAVIWIHGWGVNFYQPSYVKVGRALAQLGYTCVSVNTRMHDVGFNIGDRNGKRVRGGGYWGVTSEEGRDIAAWINFASQRGFKHVVLVGHSAGWSEVRRYQAEKHDQRVVGLISASGGFWASTEKPDEQLLAQATRLVADGHGDELLRLPNRSFASYISAATFLDNWTTPPELKDFFGLETPNPAVTRIRCPILAFFGTRDDVGTQKDLDLLKSCIKRQPSGPSRVDTILIQNADHMYTGQESQVAQRIAEWSDGLVPTVR